MAMTPVDAADIAHIISAMEVSRPELLRATPAYRALAGCGRVLRSPSTPADRCYYDLSFEVHQIDEFWSHSWHGKACNKILLLLMLKNGPAALIAGTTGALAMQVLYTTRVLPGLYSKPPLLGTGRSYEFGPYSLCAGLALTFLTFLLWRPRQSVFLDQICIHQHDGSLKTEGILNIGAVMKRSRSMLVLWDATYVERLWCIFEMAAFLKSHESEQPEIMVRPTFMAPWTCYIFASWCVFTSFELCVPYVNMIPVILKFSLVAPASFFLTAMFCKYYRAIQHMQDQLSDFKTENAKCQCCSQGHPEGAVSRGQICDRRVVLDCICMWFGSVASFEKSVQGNVFDALSLRLGMLPFTYRWLVSASLPCIWGHLDLVGARLRDGDVYWGAVTAIIALAWWLAAGPFLFILPATVANRMLKRGSLGFRDGLVLLFGSTVLVLVAVATVVFQYVCVQLMPSALVGSLVFAACMVVPALLVWRPRRNLWREAVETEVEESAEDNDDDDDDDDDYFEV